MGVVEAGAAAVDFAPFLEVLQAAIVIAITNNKLILVFFIFLLVLKFMQQK